MRIEYVDGNEYWTVETVADLKGWLIIEVEDWKDGVKRLYLASRCPPTFRVVYCRTEILEAERRRQRNEFNRQAESMGISLRA